jgi:hypothetical protein
MNAHIARSQHQMYEKWQTVDEWIASPAFQAIPDGSLILSPSLFEHYPQTVHVFDDYWTLYVREHGKKQVEVVRYRTDWRDKARRTGADDRLYFLDFTPDGRSDSSYLTFSKVPSAEDDMPMGSEEVAILAHVKADRLRVLGRLFGATAECRARVFVDGVPSESTFTDRFGAHIERRREAREWLWVRLSSEGATIDPDSILIADADVSVDGEVEVVFARGFHLDEIAYRWAESEAVVTLRNRTDRPLRAGVEFAASAPGLAPGATARLEATAGSSRTEWAIGREPEPRSLILDMPPASSVDLRFRTDAPRVVAPLDTRVLALQFQPGFRVRDEARCEGK